MGISDLSAYAEKIAGRIAALPPADELRTLHA
jgi:hypothetical protein